MKQKKLQIDTEKCMGCCACEIACKMENDLPKGVRFIVMQETEDDTFLREKLNFHFRICRHCDRPACIDACLQHAIYKREDGIVLVREDACTGCRTCLGACPFRVPQFGEKGFMQKCSLCAARIDKGLAPSCANACPAGAIQLVCSQEQ